MEPVTDATAVSALEVGVAAGLRVVDGLPYTLCSADGVGLVAAWVAIVDTVVVVVVVVVDVAAVGEGLKGGLLVGRKVMMGTNVGLGLNSDQKVVMPGGLNVGGHLVAVAIEVGGVDVGFVAVVLGFVAGRVTLAAVGLTVVGRCEDDVGVR